MTEPAPDELYLILQGVHRSVAAREAGLSGVLARVEVGGRKTGFRVLHLDQLVTTKASIARWDRGRDFRELVELMRTANGRSRIPEIVVEPVTPARAARYTRILDVTIGEYPDEDWP